jgi:membrane protease YdiL (CAAX protease family)
VVVATRDAVDDNTPPVIRPGCGTVEGAAGNFETLDYGDGGGRRTLGRAIAAALGGYIRRTVVLLIATAGFLAVYNNAANLVVDPQVWRRWYIATNLAVGAAMLALARPLLNWTQLGLGEASWLPGLAWGAVTMVGGAVVIFTSQRFPAVAEMFEDRRYAGISDGDAVRHALIRVPLGTALLEEVAFRGVLFALWEGSFSVPVAVVGTSLIFGLWHIGPVLQNLRANQVDLKSRQGLIGLGVGIALTTLAGFGLSLLRVWSAGILGPFILHWAVNALGVLTAVTRQRRLTTVAESAA